MRAATVERNTAETKIKLSLDIDGRGVCSVRSGCGFLDHMLTLFAKHARFDLDLTCDGDTWVDFHHTTEDVGIALGTAFKKCIGDKKGIGRYGSAIVPMDETLILSALDISGRAYLNFDCSFPTEKIGDFDTELVMEFWYGFVRASECTLHVKKLYGINSHHIAEGVFKSCARSFRTASAVEEGYEDILPSTKGVL